MTYTTNKKDYFEFIYRWVAGPTGTIHKCRLQSNGLYCIYLKHEKDGNEISLIGESANLNQILQNDINAADITWFDIDGTPKPFEHTFTS